jgi:hypothetical protein
MNESSETPRKILFAFSILLIMAGLIMYFVWGILYNSWNILLVENMGVYAVTIILICFGIVGAFLYSK